MLRIHMTNLILFFKISFVRSPPVGINTRILNPRTRVQVFSPSILHQTTKRPFKILNGDFMMTIHCINTICNIYTVKCMYTVMVQLLYGRMEFREIAQKKKKQKKYAIPMQKISKPHGGLSEIQLSVQRIQRAA